MFLIESDFDKVGYLTDFERERKLARTLCYAMYCVCVCVVCVCVCACVYAHNTVGLIVFIVENGPQPKYQNR